MHKKETTFSGLKQNGEHHAPIHSPPRRSAERSALLNEARAMKQREQALQEATQRGLRLLSLRERLTRVAATLPTDFSMSIAGKQYQRMDLLAALQERLGKIQEDIEANEKGIGKRSLREIDTLLSVTERQLTDLEGHTTSSPPSTFDQKRPGGTSVWGTVKQWFWK